MAGRVARAGQPAFTPPRPKQATYKTPEQVPMTATSTWADQQRRRVQRQGPIQASIEYFRSLAEDKTSLKVGDYVTALSGQGGYVQNIGENGEIAIRVANQPAKNPSIIYMKRENLNIRPGE